MEKSAKMDKRRRIVGRSTSCHYEEGSGICSRCESQGKICIPKVIAVGRAVGTAYLKPTRCFPDNNRALSLIRKLVTSEFGTQMDRWISGPSEREIQRGDSETGRLDLPSSELLDAIHLVASRYFKDSPEMAHSLDSTALLYLGMLIQEFMYEELDHSEKNMTEEMLEKAPSTTDQFEKLVPHGDFVIGSGNAPNASKSEAMVLDEENDTLDFWHNHTDCVWPINTVTPEVYQELKNQHWLVCSGCQKTSVQECVWIRFTARKQRLKCENCLVCYTCRKVCMPDNPCQHLMEEGSDQEEENTSEESS